MLFHFLLMCYLSLYGFFTKKSKYDYLYLAIVYLIVLHWTFFNGECCITYFYKKKRNPHYIAGQDPSIEYKMAFKKHANLIDFLVNINNILVAISIYLVAKRNKIPFLVCLPFILMAALIIYRNYLFKDSYKNKNYHQFQEVVRYSCIVYGFWFISIA